MEEYKRTLEDEIDWKLIDQLHLATVNFSSTSLGLKKLFFVLIGISVPILLKLADNKLDISLFITLYLLTITFWFLDGFTYFYQEKLREKMDFHFYQIKSRNRNSIIVPDNIKQDFTIEINRTKKYRIWRSSINPSVRFYIFLLLLNSIAMILFLNNVIG